MLLYIVHEKNAIAQKNKLCCSIYHQAGYTGSKHQYLRMSRVPKLIRQCGIHKIMYGVEHVLTENVMSCIIDRVWSQSRGSGESQTIHSVVRQPDTAHPVLFLKTETISPEDGTMDVSFEPLDWLLELHHSSSSSSSSLDSSVSATLNK